METHTQGTTREHAEKRRRTTALIADTREKASSALHRHPAVTVVSVGALGLAAAIYVGAGPAAVAGGAAYLAYRWLKRSPGPLYQQRSNRESAA
ncbi:MAG: hypothetical protein ACXWUG_19620 [Polyangiales bacterium]